VDKYKCGSVDWWYPGDWSKRIDALYYNGSLGNGGYNDWRSEYIDVWDQFPSPGNYRNPATYPAGSFRTNQFFLTNPIARSTDIQVWIDPVVYFCFQHHRNAYIDDEGHYQPHQYDYTRAEWHIDYNYYVESLPC
jgi:hypothetical protein